LSAPSGAIPAHPLPHRTASDPFAISGDKAVDIKRTPPSKRRKWLTYGAPAVLLLGAASVAVARIQPSAPSLDRATLLVDTVRQDDLVRQVRGPGTLVAEDIRWISAITQGRTVSAAAFAWLSQQVSPRPRLDPSARPAPVRGGCGRVRASG
jgi:hypothetical protein